MSSWLIPHEMHCLGVPDAGVAPLVPVGVVGRSASGKIELRGVKYDEEEAAEVGSS